jgi:hypothetical protein
MAEAPQHGFILKIAAGVFIGIMAALLVYSIPGWVRKHQEEQRQHEEFERTWWLEQMTPEQFPARCGKLVKDESFREILSAGVKVRYGDRIEAREVTVELTTWDGKKERVTAEWNNIADRGEQPRWSLTTIGGWKVFEEEDRRALTGLFPCLSKPLAAQN